MNNLAAAQAFLQVGVFSEHKTQDDFRRNEPDFVVISEKISESDAQRTNIELLKITANALKMKLDVENIDQQIADIEKLEMSSTLNSERRAALGMLKYRLVSHRDQLLKLIDIISRISAE